MLERCKSILPLTQEEFKLIDPIVHIVVGEWWLCAKFMVRTRIVTYDLITGKEKEVCYKVQPRYIPLDKCSSLKAGDTVRAEDLWIIDFGNIFRVLES